MMLNVYMAHDGNPSEAAILVFAHTAKEAHKLAWPYLRGYSDGDLEWIDVRAKRMKAPHLYDEADSEKLKQDEPHVIECPESCTRCEQWGKIMTKGVCEDCKDDKDVFRIGHTYHGK